MKRKRAAPATIDAYIAACPDEVRQRLEDLRATIRKAAPAAEERISYAMPTFAWHGNLAHFAAFAHHIGFYPTPSAIEKFRRELSPYETAKGSIRFPLDRPIPWKLVSKIVKFRVRENGQKAQAKAGPKGVRPSF